MEKRYQVFISSTYEDLKEERKAVIEGIMDLDCFPAGMEQFSAASTSQFEYIKKRIDESDYYVLIIGGRYGSIDENEDISYTEKEFNYALEESIPVLVFINDNIDNLPPEKRDNDKEKFNKLMDFIKRAKNGRLVAYWSNRDELKYKVNKSLEETFESNPRRGWVREEYSLIYKLNLEIENLKLENKVLKEKIRSEDEKAIQ